LEVAIYSDAAITGATMERPGMLELLTAARRRDFDLVVAEGLDRMSRSLKDMAAIYETLSYHGVGIWTAHEGRVSELHIGLKGTMNALFLKDMKEKVRRGQSARIAAGRAIAACPYGYRIVRGLMDPTGRVIHGIREINEAEAEIVRRIFQEYVSGRSAAQIARGLEADGIPGIEGRPWQPRSIRGKKNGERWEGVLFNEVYLGRLVYNKTRTMRDPMTGKKRYIPLPQESWTRVDMPEWRIISDDLWAAARRVEDERRKRGAIYVTKKPRILTTHNVHALTGWVFCGVCGARKSIANDSRYTCSGNRYGGTCRNSRGTKEPILMQAAFDALLHRVRSGTDFRPVFLQVFAKEMDHSDELRAEEGDIVVRVNRLVHMVENGVDGEVATARILELQMRLREIREALSRVILPDLPGEPTIRYDMARAIARVQFEGSIEEQRIVFGHLLKAITLTPIPGERRGETIEVTLREDGWPEFWRSIA